MASENIDNDAQLDLKRRTIALTQQLARHRRDSQLQQHSLVECISRLCTVLGQNYPSTKDTTQKMRGLLQLNQFDECYQLIEKLAHFLKDKDGDKHHSLSNLLFEHLQTMAVPSSLHSIFVADLLDQKHILRLAQSCETSRQSPEHDDQQLQENLRSALLAILEHLKVPPELTPRLDAVKLQLATNWPLSGLPQILQKIAALYDDCQRTITQVHEDLERFVRSMSDELNQLDQIAGSNNHDFIELKNIRTSLRNTLNHAFTNIDQTVQDGENDPNLRQNVGNYIANVQAEMHRINDTEDLRLTAVQNRCIELQSRINNMEQESKALNQLLNETQNRLLHDPLTGIANRFAYEEQFTQLLEKPATEQLHYALLDIDFFKQINDTYGHKAGDRVLCLIAQLMQKSIRDTDFIARIGGEEFALLLPDCTPDVAYRVCERVRQSIHRGGFNFRGEALNLTISCGLTQALEGEDHDTIYERADSALYKAKQSGRNQIIVF